MAVHLKPLLVALCLSLVASRAAAEPALDAAADEAVSGLAKAIGEAKRKKKPVAVVAVPAFKEAGSGAKGLGATAAEQWGAALAHAAKVKVLDRTRLASMLDDTRLSAVGEGEKQELKRLAAAQATLVGTVQDAGPEIVVTSQLVLNATGELLATSRQAVPRAQLASAEAAPPAGQQQAAEAPKPAAEPSAASQSGGVESSSVQVEMRKLADKLAEAFDKLPGKARYRRLAVIPFNDLGEEPRKHEIGAIVTAELATCLRRDHGLLLVERAQLAAIFEELKLQTISAEDLSAVPSLGKMADAQALIIGSVAQAGDRYLVNARLVSTSDSQILAAESSSLPAAGMVALASDAVVLRSRSGAVFRSILIPGWGQFYNRQAWKGWGFIGLEVAALGGALAFQLAGNDAYDDYKSRTSAEQLGPQPSETASELYDTASSRYRVRNAFLIAAAGIWAINVVDAYASGVDGESMLSGGVASGGLRFTPIVAVGPGGGDLGLKLSF